MKVITCDLCGKKMGDGMVFVEIYFNQPGYSEFIVGVDKQQYRDVCCECNNKLQKAVLTPLKK